MRILQLDSHRTALEAAQLFTVFDTGLLEVIEAGRSLGRISERDLIQRVVALRLKPEEVTLGQLAESSRGIFRLDVLAFGKTQNIPERS